MADNYPVLARAVSNLPNNTAPARQELYERARAIVVAELRRTGQRKSASEIVREHAALETAIRKVEAQSPSGRAATPDAVAQTTTTNHLAKILHELEPDAVAARPANAVSAGARVSTEELGGMLNSVGAMMLRVTYIVAALAFTGVIYIRGLVLVAADVIVYPVLLVVVAVMLGLFVVAPRMIFRKKSSAPASGIALRHAHSAPRRAS